MLERDLETILNDQAPAHQTAVRAQPHLLAAAYQAFCAVEPQVAQVRDHAKERAQQAGQPLRVLILGCGPALTAAPALAQEHEGLAVEAVHPKDVVAAPGDYVRAGDHVLVMSLCPGVAKAQELHAGALAQLASVAGADVVALAACTTSEGALATYAREHEVPFMALPASEHAQEQLPARFITPLYLALLAFDTHTPPQREARMHEVKRMVESVVMREDDIARLAQDTTARYVFWGTGAQAGVATYASHIAAKLLGDHFTFTVNTTHELEVSDSLGDDACVIAFIPTAHAARHEDLAVLDRIHQKGSAARVIAVQQDFTPRYSGESFSFDGFSQLHEGYLSISYSLVAYMFLALLAQVVARRA
jgi:hypothetical protein